MRRTLRGFPTATGGEEKADKEEISIKEAEENGSGETRTSAAPDEKGRGSSCCLSLLKSRR